jgi:hypothetical protein
VDHKGCGIILKGDHAGNILIHLNIERNAIRHKDKSGMNKDFSRRF